MRCRLANFGRAVAHVRGSYVPEATLQARLEAEVSHKGPLPPYGHRLAGCFLVLYLIKVVKNPF